MPVGLPEQPIHHFLYVLFYRVERKNNNLGSFEHSKLKRITPFPRFTAFIEFTSKRSSDNMRNRHAQSQLSEMNISALSVYNISV